MNKLWIVWSPSISISVGTDNFCTNEQAVERANELALKHPRDKFYVCETIGVATCTTVQYTKID